MPTKVSVVVELDAELYPKRIGTLHASWVTIEPQEATGGRKVEISGGHGLGNSNAYVAVDGKRVLATSLQPLFEALTDAALKACEVKGGG